MSYDLRGKVVFITGGSRGIGAGDELAAPARQEEPVLTTQQPDRLPS